MENYILYYHGRIMMSDKTQISFVNESEEYILQNMVIPFINGQVIECDYVGGKLLINMKSASNMSIYKSSEKFDEMDFRRQQGVSINEKYSPFDCTAEFVEQVKELQSHPAMKSLLEMSFQPPEDKAFVVMKFGDEILDSAYQGVIKPICEEYGLEVVRVDEIQDSGKINDQILENIASSKIVISDLSGERPNCYYETGFAHALGKNIILTIHEDSKIHFDLAAHRFIQWKTEFQLREALKTRLDKVIVRGK